MQYMFTEFSERNCKEPYCDRTDIRARGWCNAHYARWKRGATMDMPMRRHRHRRYDVPDGMAHCTECDKVIPIDRFHRSTYSPIGLDSRCKSCQSKRKQISKYGVSLEELLDAQGGKCGICETDSPGNPGWRIDHDHLTGNVRGVLCHPCNVSLGLFKDSIESLRNAVAYLSTP